MHSLLKIHSHYETLLSPFRKVQVSNHNKFACLWSINFHYMGINFEFDSSLLFLLFFFKFFISKAMSELYSFLLPHRARSIQMRKKMCNDKRAEKNWRWHAVHYTNKIHNFNWKRWNKIGVKMKKNSLSLSIHVHLNFICLREPIVFNVDVAFSAALE